MQSKTSSKASGRTKKLIARSLKELCKTNPLRKITIRDIVEHCDINRSTFYYHFVDKQDVINYVYHVEVTQPLREHFFPGAEKWDELTLYSLQLMYKSKDFYSQAFRITGQNDIQSFILSEVLENWRIVADRSLRSLNLISEGSNLKDLYYLSDYLAYGAFSMMKTWVLSGMEEPPERIAGLLQLAGTMGMNAYGKVVDSSSGT